MPPPFGAHFLRRSAKGVNYPARVVKAFGAVAAFSLGLFCGAPLFAQNPIIEADGNNAIYYYTGTATLDSIVHPTTISHSVVVGKMPGGTYLSSDGDTDIGTTDATKFTLTVAKGADNIYGSGIYDGLEVFNRNSVNMTGGIVGSADAHGNSTFSISGGTINYLTAYDNSTVNFSGGGGSSGGGTLVSLFDNNRAKVSGGTISQLVTNNNSSTVDITGGTLNSVGGLSAGSSVFNISGGSIAQVGGAGQTYNITGGSIGILGGGTVDSGRGTVSSSVFNLYGGTIGANGFSMRDNSVLNVYGTNLGLALTGVASDSYGTYTGYTLSGLLQNGQSINGVTFRDYNGGYQITNPANPNGPTSPLNFFGPAAVGAPEPASFALFAFAGAPLAVTRARRRRARK